MNSQDDIYVQYGCGINAPQSWINFDASPNLRLERLPLIGTLYAGVKMVNGKPQRQRFPSNIKYGDIVKGLPLKANSVQGIFASHVLEHLSLEDCELALSNTFSLLKSGGIFRLIVPNLKEIAMDYVNSSEPSASVVFMQQTLLGKSTSNKNFKSLLSDWLGNSHHLWMWDYSSLELSLKKNGFINIREAFFNDSEDPKFAEVEEKARFSKSVCVECQKK